MLDFVEQRKSHTEWEKPFSVKEKRGSKTSRKYLSKEQNGASPWWILYLIIASGYSCGANGLTDQEAKDNQVLNLGFFRSQGKN